MTTSLPDNDICSLRNLTGQESGIVVYPGGNIIVCNWSGLEDNEIPSVFCGLFLTGTPVDHRYFTNYDQWIVDDLYSELCDIGDKIIWDLNGDMLDIANNDKPVKATVYKFNDNVYVFAPHGWQ